MMTSTSKKMAAVVLAVTVAMSLSACSNMSKRDRNTAIGAGAGAIGGAVLTDGSALWNPGWRGGRWYYWSPGWQII